MKNSRVYNFLFLFTLLISIQACTPEPIDEFISTTIIEDNNPCEDQEVAFLDPFPEVKIQCGEQDKEFYKNESGKDQVITVMGTDKCEDFDSYIELQKEETNDEGETKIVTVKEMDIPDGKSKVKTWTLKDGQFLTFYCEGSDPEGACNWVVSVK